MSDATLRLALPTVASIKQRAKERRTPSPAWQGLIQVDGLGIEITTDGHRLHRAERPLRPPGQYAPNAARGAGPADEVPPSRFPFDVWREANEGLRHGERLTPEMLEPVLTLGGILCRPGMHAVLDLAHSQIRCSSLEHKFLPFDVSSQVPALLGAPCVMLGYFCAAIRHAQSEWLPAVELKWARSVLQPIVIGKHALVMPIRV